MVFKKYFSLLALCIPFLIETTEKVTEGAPAGSYEVYLKRLDTIAHSSLKWYASFMQELPKDEQIEFYNGLQDISEFSAYHFAYEKRMALATQLIALVNRTSIENEQRILEALHSTVQALLESYPTKTELEMRVELFRQQCSEYAPFKRAFDAFSNDFLSSLPQESSDALFTRLESTRISFSELLQSITRMQYRIRTEGIVKNQCQEKMLDYYYDCLKEISDSIYHLADQTTEAQNLLNESILLYTDVIIRNTTDLNQ